MGMPLTEVTVLPLSPDDESERWRSDLSQATKAALKLFKIIQCRKLLSVVGVSDRL